MSSYPATGEYHPKSNANVCLYDDAADDLDLPDVGKTVRMIVTGKVTSVSRNSSTGGGKRAEVSVDVRRVVIAGPERANAREERMKRV